jgi:hypothetical protein
MIERILASLKGHASLIEILVVNVISIVRSAAHLAGQSEALVVLTEKFSQAPWSRFEV